MEKKASSAGPAFSSENAGHEDKDDFRNTMHASADMFTEEKLVQFVVFSLGDQEFGVDIEQVNEIVRIDKFAPIPDSPEFIRGLTNVRGTIIAVIDLKKRFALREENGVEGKHIIITREQKNILGVLVDEVTEVLRVVQKEIRPAPGLTTIIHKKYISGVITAEERMIILLDLKSVLSEEELKKLTQLQNGTMEKDDLSFNRKVTAKEEKEIHEANEAENPEIKTKRKKTISKGTKEGQ